MKKNVGLWIDHTKAVIVFVTSDAHEIREISSETTHHPHSQAVADDTRQNVQTEYLNRYYEEIVSIIGDADSVLIFGPGEAKGELKKRLEHDNFSQDKIHIESADKMTEPQIAAKVREHFHI